MTSIVFFSDQLRRAKEQCYFQKSQKYECDSTAIPSNSRCLSIGAIPCQYISRKKDLCTAGYTGALGVLPGLIGLHRFLLGFLIGVGSGMLARTFSAKNWLLSIPGATARAILYPPFRALGAQLEMRPSQGDIGGTESQPCFNVISGESGSPVCPDIA